MKGRGGGEEEGRRRGGRQEERRRRGERRRGEENDGVYGGVRVRWNEQEASDGQEAATAVE